MPADHLSVGGYNLAVLFGQRTSLLLEIRLDETDVVARGYEANLLALRLFGDRECGAPGNGAHLLLGQLAEREDGASHLLLSQAEEEIGLVLGGVASTQQLVAAGRRILLDAGVMPSGQAVSANLPRHHQQLVKLDVVIAQRARNRRAPGQVFVDERAHNSFLKLVLEVDDVVREAQVLGHTPRVVHIVERAAAVVHRTVAMHLRQAPLVPELHG